MKVFGRIGSAVAVALTMMGVAGAPAMAAPPSNDVYSGAVAIGSVPFTVDQDTTEATTDADDAELNVTCEAPAMDASVWYSFTPADDGFYLADASASDYSAGVFVATGAPGSFEILGCSPGSTGWEATAGTAYSIIVIDDQLDGVGNGGAMHLSVDVAPPPPAEPVVTINPTGRFDAKTGSAILSGTIQCDPSAGGELLVDLTQRVGRVLIRGSGGTVVACDGTVRPWTVEVVGDNGLFKGGKAVTVTIAFTCNVSGCSEYFAEQRVQLKGKK